MMRQLKIVVQEGSGSLVGIVIHVLSPADRVTAVNIQERLVAPLISFIAVTSSGGYLSFSDHLSLRCLNFVSALSTLDSNQESSLALV